MTKKIGVNEKRGYKTETVEFFFFLNETVEFFFFLMKRVEFILLPIKLTFLLKKIRTFESREI